MTIRRPKATSTGRRTTNASSAHRDDASLATPAKPSKSATHRHKGRPVSPGPPGRAGEQQLGPNDVICGRDIASLAHVGNKAFRRIVREFQGRYQATTARTEKARIVASVVLAVRKKGGRFVAPGERPGAWHEVEAKVATLKIQSALNSRKNPALAWLRTGDAPPSQEEDAAYHDLLMAQRAMFSNLLEQEEC